ncbi:hypothetical protein [Parendozoicomonas haliclonae]|uniref:Uncharacterized protein n=1 Tax=Parendozoicomonas haliclonae TaxID=1960125 RepID=A0A1X7ANS6_9GAMM|nr:hypothetical protein [Parendozoicomonas haliclonae]SMA49782.1 hypothetical protein EHSB41UT_03571 [Parendozoicomonas haliclonae]
MHLDLRINNDARSRSNPIASPYRADMTLCCITDFGGRRRKVSGCCYSDGEQQIELSCHHVVPNSRLQAYWNAHLANGHLECSRKFLDQMWRCIGDYSVRHHGSTVDASRLVQRLVQERIEFDQDGLVPDGLDAFGELFSYMPGNMFMGPSASSRCCRRGDDPLCEFEKNAWVVIGYQPYRILWDLNETIQDYLITPTAERASTISNLLTIVVQKREPYAMDRHHWLLKRRTYRLKVDYDAIARCGSNARDRDNLRSLILRSDSLDSLSSQSSDASSGLDTPPPSPVKERVTRRSGRRSHCKGTERLE